MLWLLPAIALAGDVLPDADLVLLGSVTTVEAGAPRDLWRFAKAKSFRVVLPPERPPHVCVSVRDVLYGELFGEVACFWRVGLAAQDPVAVGTDAVWFLDRAAPLDVWYMDDPDTTHPADQAGELKLLLAQRSRQPGGKALPQPTVADAPTLREALKARGGPASVALTIEQGSAVQKRDAIAIAAEYTLLESVPALVAALTDVTLVPGTTPQRPVGLYAADALATLSARIDPAPRPPQEYGFPGGPLTFSARSGAVQQTWSTWWKSWQESGPAVE